MADTRIAPEDFLLLTKAKYFRMLEKDLAKLSRKPGFKDYIYIKNFKGGRITTKTSLLLFTSLDDENWGPVLDKALKGFKVVEGQCKVVSPGDLDEDGDDDIVVAIKTAKGDYTKGKTVELLNETVFEGNNDFEVVMMNEMDEIAEKTKTSSLAGVEKDSSGFINDLIKLDESGHFRRFLEKVGLLLQGKTTGEFFNLFRTKMNWLKREAQEKSPVEAIDMALELDLSLENTILNIESLLTEARELGRVANSQFPEIWAEQEKVIVPLLKLLVSLKRKLDKMEAAIEDHFKLDGPAEKVIDKFNEMAQKFRDSYALEGKAFETAIQEIEQEMLYWRDRLDERSKNVVEAGLAFRLKIMYREFDQLTRLKVPTGVKIHGTTHLVKEVNRSIFDGDQSLRLLKSGQLVVIDSQHIVVSRRGPNQEIKQNRRDDQTGPQIYEWFHVLEIDGEDVSNQSWYLREATFHPAGRDLQVKGYKTLVELDEHAGSTMLKYHEAIRRFNVNPEMSFDEMLEMLREAGFGGSIHKDENLDLVEHQGFRANLVREMTEALELAERPLTGDEAAIRDGILIHPFHEGGCLAAQQRMLTDKVNLVKRLLEGDYKKIPNRVQFKVVDKIHEYLTIQLQQYLDSKNSKTLMKYKTLLGLMPLQLTAAVAFQLMNARLNSTIIMGTIEEAYQTAEAFMKNTNIQVDHKLLSDLVGHYSEYKQIWEAVNPATVNIKITIPLEIRDLINRLDDEAKKIEEDQNAFVKDKFVKKIWKDREKYSVETSIRISREDAIIVTWELKGGKDFFRIKNSTTGKNDAFLLFGTEEDDNINTLRIRLNRLFK